MKLKLAVIALVLLSSAAWGYYYPPANIPPKPPPNYTQIDTVFFLGTPEIPLPPPDSGGYYIWNDSGKWNVAFHIYSGGNSLEQFHGSILAVMGRPPEVGVNVFPSQLELFGETAANQCFRQNDRWGWVQWGDSLYEIWWDMCTREFRQGEGDPNDLLRFSIVGCALDFNLWSSDHSQSLDDNQFDASQVRLGKNKVLLSTVGGFVDFFDGLSDPYQAQAGSDPANDRNVTIFTPKSLPGAAFNKFGQIQTSEAYTCDSYFPYGNYGSRYAGSWAYEGNGLQFSTRCAPTFRVCDPLIPPPVIISVLDVGNDEGRQARVTWCASSRDVLEEPHETAVHEYLIYRRIDRLPDRALAKSSSGQLAAAFPPGDWDFITSVPAVDQRLYNRVVPTLEDSGALNLSEFYSVFFIRASNHNRGIFYDSEADSGYSKVNIAPISPSRLAAAPNAGRVALTWASVPELDLWGYRVYRDTAAGFATAAMLGQTGSPSFEDGDPLLGKPLYYRVAAVDSAGNEGKPSLPAKARLAGKGDLNLDGALSGADAVLLLGCLFTNMGDCSQSVADCNCDGYISAADLITLLSAAFSGIPFPCN